LEKAGLGVPAERYFRFDEQAFSKLREVWEEIFLRPEDWAAFDLVRYQG